MKLGVGSLCLFIAATLAWAADDATSPPTGLNLRQRILDFAKTQRDKLNAFEDQQITHERQFIDRLRLTLRDADGQYGEELAASQNWARAKADYRDKMRKLQRDLRQQVRIRREEIELELLRFVKDRETELKSFADTLESEMKELKKDPSFAHASKDFDEGRGELKDAISRFRERVRNLKPKENFWE